MIYEPMREMLDQAERERRLLCDDFKSAHRSIEAWDTRMKEAGLAG